MEKLVVFSKVSRDEKQLQLAKQFVEALAHKLDSKVSIRLWDGSVIPLGTDPVPGLELSLSGPGVIGSLIRRPTAENLLCHYVNASQRITSAFEIDLQIFDSETGLSIWVCAKTRRNHLRSIQRGRHR